MKPSTVVSDIKLALVALLVTVLCIGAATVMVYDGPDVGVWGPPLPPWGSSYGR